MTSHNLFEIQDHLFGDKSGKDSNTNINPTFTSSQKWWYSLILAVLFLIFSSSILYSLTSSISTALGLPVIYVTPGGTTFYGLFIHTLLFFFLVRILMG